MISKQKAIEALVSVTIYNNKEEIFDMCDRFIFQANGWLGGVAECIKALEDLPSINEVK